MACNSEQFSQKVNNCEIFAADTQQLGMGGWPGKRNVNGVRIVLLWSGFCDLPNPYVKTIPHKVLGSGVLVD